MYGGMYWGMWNRLRAKCMSWWEMETALTCSTTCLTSDHLGQCSQTERKSQVGEVHPLEIQRESPSGYH